MRPFGSMRKPMRYITSTTTTGAAWFSLITTRSPLGSFRYTTGTEKDAFDCACAEGGGLTSAARQRARSLVRIGSELNIGG